MSIIRYETVIKTVEDIYQFKLSNIALSTRSVYLIDGSDDDTSDFNLMWDKLNKENKEYFKRSMASIQSMYYKDISPEGFCVCNEDQSLELKVEYYDRFSPLGFKVTVRTTITEKETAE